MTNYDDDETFADDEPADLHYRVQVDELRAHLVHQLHAIAEDPDTELHPEAVEHHVETRLLPAVSRSGHAAIDRTAFHDRLRSYLYETIPDDEVRARVASEVLTALSVLHEPEVA